MNQEHVGTYSPSSSWLIGIHQSPISNKWRVIQSGKGHKHDFTLSSSPSHFCLVALIRLLIV